MCVVYCLVSCACCLLCVVRFVVCSWVVGCFLFVVVFRCLLFVVVCRIVDDCLWLFVVSCFVSCVSSSLSLVFCVAFLVY